MAKRTPRSEAPDSSTAAAPARPEKARSTARARRDADNPPPPERASEPVDTLGARPEPADERPSMDAPAPEPQAESIAAGPTEEDIRVRAYHRYLERGCSDGMDFEDWLVAEQELRTR